MTFAQTWFIWLAALAVIVPLLERYRRKAVKNEYANINAKMRQFEKMAEHGSPARGLMSMVMSNAGTMADETIGPIIVWLVGLGLLALLVTSLLAGIGIVIF